MQVVPRDLVEALGRWRAALRKYDAAQCEPIAAAELLRATEALAAAYDDMAIPPDERSAADRMSAESGRGD